MARVLVGETTVLDLDLGMSVSLGANVSLTVGVVLLEVSRRRLRADLQAEQQKK